MTPSPPPRRRLTVAPIAFVVGAPSPERDAVMTALAAANVTPALRSEGELLGAREGTLPALLVLDDQRPREERMATQLRLRSHPALHGVPVLVVSHDCSIDSFGGAIGAGASAFVRLPGDQDELVETARRLSTWRSHRSSPEARRGARRPLLLEVDVDLAGHEDVRGRIVDASTTGCRLELPMAADEGAQLGIVPRSCDDSTQIRLGGIVRWCRAGTHGFTTAVRWTGTAGIVARRVLGLGPVAPPLP